MTEVGPEPTEPGPDPGVAHLAPVAGAAAVELRGIHKRFGANEVLCGVDLTVRAGEHVVVFGPSGSGKSTLLRTMNLLEEPQEGSVKVDGVEYGPGLAGDPRAPRGRRPSCAARSAWSSSPSTCSRT